MHVADSDAPSLGKAIPETDHAVSVSLPTWESCVGYEEGQAWVTSKMETGYPRFFIHKKVQALSKALLQRYGTAHEMVSPYPSKKTASRCLDFMISHANVSDDVGGAASRPRLVEFELDCSQSGECSSSQPVLFAAVFYSPVYASVAKAYWQHVGEGVSSRRAEFLWTALHVGHIDVVTGLNTQSVNPPSIQKGPRRYRKTSRAAQLPPHHIEDRLSDKTAAETRENRDWAVFLEERFGRNLSVEKAALAKMAVRRRISGALANSRDPATPIAMTTPEYKSPERADGLETDVYLYPSGMNAIFHSHQALLNVRGPARSVMFGFPYIDTLKILQKFGPGCMFYGNGSEQDLDDLEARSSAGERFLSLYCEFPGNPLLLTPNLKRIRSLADRYGFAVVVDETIGNFLNVNVLADADIVVSSLTKVFSGDCNVMSGSLTVSRRSVWHTEIKEFFSKEYEDNLFDEDAIYLERNSRDFLKRNHRINLNAEALVALLSRDEKVKAVFYPTLGRCKAYYEQYKTAEGGYGGLLSISFHKVADAKAFYDALQVAKGPSLGTNFTLCSPYVILAHYTELAWAAEFGVDPNLVRVSVGLEDRDTLVQAFSIALESLKHGPE